MKKQTIFYFVVGVAILGLIAGGLYAYKFRGCVKKVYYQPPREGSVPNPNLSGLQRVVDKGDYYEFMGLKFKTSEDAIRACIWK